MAFAPSAPGIGVEWDIDQVKGEEHLPKFTGANGGAPR